MNKKLFESHFSVSLGCWLWKGCKTIGGYGRFNVGKRVIKMAHRVSYELYVGPIPKGFQVCHSCDVRHCVRPSHLWIGTQTDNMLDMYKKNRHVKMSGEKNPSVIRNF